MFRGRNALLIYKLVPGTALSSSMPQSAPRLPPAEPCLENPYSCICRQRSLSDWHAGADSGTARAESGTEGEPVLLAHCGTS